VKTYPPHNRRPEDRAYFFDAGIRFACIGCGQCCTGAPGTVFMNRETSERIAAHLRLAHAEFLERYAYPFRNGHSLREKPNGDCIFLEQNRCTIYPVRPPQCRTYPFWPENLRSEAAWARTCKECPGIGAGRLYRRDEIIAFVQESLDAER
jgi:Fe-S-cluster containining protein